jgi:hypothetical protein
MNLPSIDRATLRDTLESLCDELEAYEIQHHWKTEKGQEDSEALYKGRRLLADLKRMHGHG